MSIHTLVSEGRLDDVRGALASGVPVDCRDEHDFTPLAYAASSSAASRDLLQLLIESGADVNAPIANSKHTPLELAANAGAIAKVDLLLSAGADIHRESPKGYTILLNAIFALHDDDRLPSMIDFLMEQGAIADSESEYGESPLSVASRLCRFDAIQSLLAGGADPSPLRWTKLLEAVALGTLDDVQSQLTDELLEQADRWERTPWLLAVATGDVSKAKLLHRSGASAKVCNRGGETAPIVCATLGHIEMLKWLIELGVDVDAADGMQNTALMRAADMGQTKCMKLLLDAGVDAGRKNDYGESAISMASTEEGVRLLTEFGETIGDISSDMKRELTGLDGDKSLAISKGEYDFGCRRRFGNDNPEVMNIPLWREMVRAGISAYEAKAQFDDQHNMMEATWCFSRFGMSFTELPDGRFVQIGGEHEDYYDPDFCIYNDVVVHERTGAFQIMGYPQTTFPPTDFHSATYVDGSIFIIGGLGYHGARQFDFTPIYRLSCTSWKIEMINTTGVNPGWIYEHRAQFTEANQIAVSAGKICTQVDGEEVHVENSTTYFLNLANLTWRTE